MTDLKLYLEQFSGTKTLMTVYPHPDDETMAAGGILLLAKSLGWKTVVVCLTKGGAGKMLINPQGRSTKEVREMELIKAAKWLLVDEVVIGDFSDGELLATREKWETWVAGMFEKFNPGVVVTYDRSGMTGHPDHISLSVAVQEIFLKRKARPMVLWTALPEQVRNRIVPEALWEYASVPSLELDLKMAILRKWLAARSHKSQPLRPAELWWMPLLFLLLIYRREWYYEMDFKKSYPHKFIEFKI